tara:strand:- start:5125 stop:5526 length:402 start_codon:yes stop_codon:yes gene_type:complete
VDILTIAKQQVVELIMTGSDVSSDIMKAVTNYNWTFKQLMIMDETVRQIIVDMEQPTLEDIVNFLGKETRDNLLREWIEKASYYGKSQLVEMIDEAPVMLSQVDNIPPPIEEKKIKLTKEELKNQIKKDTKVI